MLIKVFIGTHCRKGYDGVAHFGRHAHESIAFFPHQFIALFRLLDGFVSAARIEQEILAFAHQGHDHLTVSQGGSQLNDGVGVLFVGEQGFIPQRPQETPVIVVHQQVENGGVHGQQGVVAHEQRGLAGQPLQPGEAGLKPSPQQGSGQADAGARGQATRSTRSTWAANSGLSWGVSSKGYDLEDRRVAKVSRLQSGIMRTSYTHSLNYGAGK